MFHVKDPSWTKAIEAAIPGSLSAFVVMNDRDFAKLLALRKRMKMNYVSVLRRTADNTWDCSRGEPDEKFLTVLRALEFLPGHTECMRALVDQSAIEKTVLVRTRREGDTLMRFNAPRQTNIKRCITEDAFDMGGIRGGSSTKASSIARTSKLSRSSPFDLQACQERIATTRTDLARERSDHEAWKADQGRKRAKGKRQMGQLLKKARELKKRLVDVKDEITELQQELAEAASDSVPGLQAEMDLAKENAQAAGSQLESTQAHLAQLEAQQRAVDEAIAKLDRDANDFARQLADLHQRIDEETGSQGRSQERANKFDNTTLAYAKKVKDLKALLTTAREVFAAEKAKAAQHGARKHVKDSVKYLQQRIQLHDAEINKHRKDPSFDLAAAEDAFLSIRDKVDFAVNAINDLKLLHAAHVRSLAQRRAWWILMRESKTIQAKQSFTSLVDQNMRGAPKASSSSCTRTRSSRFAYIARDGNRINLEMNSGGEHSHVQLYFLIALWDNSPSPLRILDEVDVYTDATTRRNMNKAIYKYALEARQQRQWILSSPQDIVIPPEYAKAINVIILKK